MENDRKNNVFSGLESGSDSGSDLKSPSRNQIFAKKLKERRELFGFTQAELAEKLECSLGWLLMDKGLEPESPGTEK